MRKKNQSQISQEQRQKGVWDKRKLSEIRGRLLRLGGSTGPPSGPCLPVAVPPGRASHATWGLVCVTDERGRSHVWPRETGDRHSVSGTTRSGKRPPRSAGPGPRGTWTGKEHVRGRHRPQNRGQRDRLRGTVLVHERQRESLHGSTENRKIKFKISFTLLVCGIVRKESCS